MTLLLLDHSSMSGKSEERRNRAEIRILFDIDLKFPKSIARRYF